MRGSAGRGQPKKPAIRDRYGQQVDLSQAPGLLRDDPGYWAIFAYHRGTPYARRPPGGKPAELRITSVFSCVACRFIPDPSFMFASCCWCRLLAVDGASGTPRGHVRSAESVTPMTACTVQGMARGRRAGQARRQPRRRHQDRPGHEDPRPPDLHRQAGEEAPQLPRPGHGIGHLRRRGRLPQLR
jgi:hypothetical protein